MPRNKRLKLTAPGSWEELRLCPNEISVSLKCRGAAACRRRSLSASR